MQPSQPCGQGFVPHKEDQLSLENWSSVTGGKRALGGRWEFAANGLMAHSYMNQFLSACLDNWDKSTKTPGKFSAVYSLMSDKKALLHVFAEGLCHVISNDIDGRKRNLVTTELGKRSEFVLWLLHPQWKGSLHLKGLRLANGRTLEMSLIRKRLMDKGFKKAADYKPLDKDLRLALGTLILEMVAKVTGLIEFQVETIGYKKRPALICRMTDRYWDFMRQYQRNLWLYRPIFMPMVVPPQEWTGLSSGGFLSLGTTVSTIPWERWESQMKTAHPCVLGSVNHLQKQAFRLNHDGFELLRQVWDLGYEVGSLPCRERLEKPVDAEYRKRRKDGEQQSSAFWAAYWKYKADQRKNSLRTLFIHAIAAFEQLKTIEKVWFVWFFDQRFRMYQRGSQLSMMSPDWIRSQIMFDESSPMRGHEQAFIWAVGDAWGISKSQDARREFFIEHEDMILRTGFNPVDCIGWWERSKEPWRFASLCREWTNYRDDPDYQTRLIFRLDQTNSGYGHAACLLRDAALAEYTCVTGDSPNDLYVQILDSANEALMNMYLALDKNDEKEAKQMRCINWWLHHPLDRSLIKDTTMPVIYGQSVQSRLHILECHCRDIVGGFLTEDGLRVADLAIVAQRGIQVAITTWLPGILDLHRWLSKAAKLAIDSGYPPNWKSPNGVTVLSYGTEQHQHDMFLDLSGRRLRISTSVCDGVISSRKSYGRLAADYIHSMDAAFLQRFIWHWKTYDYPIVTVHDCVGTTLNKAELLGQELCDQFSRFYSDDHLLLLKGRIEDQAKHLNRKLPDPPCRGTLDVHQIGSNPFLFC